MLKEILVLIVDENNARKASFRFDYRVPFDVEETLQRVFPLLLTRGTMFCEQLEFPLRLNGVKLEQSARRKV